MLTELASREKVIGVKQSARAIRDGRAQRVFLACDADELVLEPIRIACGSLPVEEGYTMAQLGHGVALLHGETAAGDTNGFQNKLVRVAGQKYPLGPSIPDRSGGLFHANHFFPGSKLCQHGDILLKRMENSAEYSPRSLKL